MTYLTKEAIQEEIKRLAKKKIKKDAWRAKTAEKYRTLFQKRTGIPVDHDCDIIISHVAPQFDPHYCLKQKNSLARLLSKKISNMEYQPRSALWFSIPKANGSKRHIMAFGIPDSAISNLVMRALRERNRQYMAKSSYAYDPATSLDDAINNMKSFAIPRTGFFAVKVDFENFFDSVPHGWIEETINHRDFEITSIEKDIIRKFVTHSYAERRYYETDEILTRDIGTPQGASLSTFVANSVCSELDHQLIAIGVCPARFADDILVLCDTYEQAQRAIDLITDFCRRSGLQIHEDKSDRLKWISSEQIAPVPGVATDTSIDFLGISFVPRKGAVMTLKRLSSMKQRASRLINLNLNQYLLDGFSRTRCQINPSYDWDLFRLIHELRGWLYEGYQEADLALWRSGTAPVPEISRTLAHLRHLEDETYLKKFDGWLLNTVRRAMVARNKTLRKVHDWECPTPGNSELVSGDWMELEHLTWQTIKNPDARMPSLTRAWRSVRSGPISSGGKTRVYPEE